MIRHMFVFGVIVPTIITIVLFVGFLICWFKFNIKDRVLKSQFFKKHFIKGVPEQNSDMIHNSIAFSPDSSNPDHQWEDQELNEPRGPPNKGNIQQFNIRESRKRLLNNSNYMGDDRLSVGSIEDSRTNLCQASTQSTAYGPNSNYSNNTCSENFIHNPSWQHLGREERLAPNPPINQSHPNGMVQQTFHFPELDQNQLKCATADLHWCDPGSESMNPNDANYGHFVLPSQVTSLMNNTTANNKFLPMKYPPEISDNEQQSYPPQSIWPDDVTCSDFENHPNRIAKDPTTLSPMYCARSVQDYDRAGAKFTFPSDIQPALITGI